MNPPLLFCHYGNSDYLAYTLRCAKFNNPNKDIVLLGDECNRRIALKYGIRHVLFSKYNHGENVVSFDSHYKLIKGNKFNNIRGNKDWVNFVFKRWYYVYNFIMSENINSFWHFDSDNMIVDALANHEHKFADYDCTEQCNGICMNGYISSPEVLYGYINKINELFQRKEYLDSQQKEFDEINPGYAFSEMRAYDVFKKEEMINSIRLNTIIDNSSFDDCICQRHGMQMDSLLSDTKIKKVLLGPGGIFWCINASDGSLIKMNSLNLSWVPLYIFHVVMQHSLKRSQWKVCELFHSKKAHTLASQSIPMQFLLKDMVSSTIGKVKGLLPQDFNIRNNSTIKGRDSGVDN